MEKDLTVRVARLTLVVGTVLGLAAGLSWTLGSSVRAGSVQTGAVAGVGDAREQVSAIQALSATVACTSYLPLVLRGFEARLDPDDPWYVIDLQWALAKVKAPQAWAVTTGDGVLVAIVDSGTDLTHPDLYDSLWINPGEIAGNGEDDDDNGYVDDVYGWDFTTGDNEPQDGNGHGTHVSGIAGATTNNGLGIAGMGWGVKLMIVRVLNDQGTGGSWEVSEGIRYAADRGANVINLSLGTLLPNGDYLPEVRDAVAYAQSKGALVVAAAGNDNTDYPFFYPAAYAGVLGVSATDENDQKASFSNYGSYIDVAAPGVNIYSTMPGGVYDYMSGTSMAAPMVSGLAALIWARYPSATASEVAAMIVDGADDVGSAGWDAYYGWGRINAVHALAGSQATVASEVTLELRQPPDVRVSSTPLGNYVPGELVVRLRNSPKGSAQQIDEWFTGQGLSVLRVGARANLYLLRVEYGQEMAVALALQQNRDVVYAHPNYVLSAAR